MKASRSSSSMTSITPFARFQGISNNQAAFSESGASSLSLSVAQQTTSSLRTIFGAQLGASMDLGLREKIDAPLRLAQHPTDHLQGVGDIAREPAMVLAHEDSVESRLVRVLRVAQHVGDDPFDGQTLEWATTSPAPANNFADIHIVQSAEPLLDLKTTNRSDA